MRCSLLSVYLYYIYFDHDDTNICPKRMKVHNWKPANEESNKDIQFHIKKRLGGACLLRALSLIAKGVDGAAFYLVRLFVRLASTVLCAVDGSRGDIDLYIYIACIFLIHIFIRMAPSCSINCAPLIHDLPIPSIRKSVLRLCGSALYIQFKECVAFILYKRVEPNRAGCQEVTQPIRGDQRVQTQRTHTHKCCS